MGLIFQLSTEYTHVFMWDADTIIIGIIIQFAIGYEIEYVTEKNVKNQETKYRILKNNFNEIHPFTHRVSQAKHSLSVIVSLQIIIFLKERWDIN